MGSRDDVKMELIAKYADLEVKFTGSPSEVVRGLLTFLSRIIPTFELVSDLTISTDLEDLLKRLKGIIAFAEEGPVILIPRDRLSERDALILHLVKSYVSYRIGKVEKESLSMAELLTLTGTKPGTAAARLSEVVSLGYVERIGRGEYRVTTLGIKNFLDEILPRLKVSEV
ncbi:MAG: hypothetical protein QXI39_05875 [Candidatus Bathyarchaeia archaeon]